MHRGKADPCHARAIGKSAANRRPFPQADGKLLVAICGFGRELQLFVHLVQKVLGLLGVALHIPFIGFLCRGDFFIGLMAEPLRGRDVGMASGGYILFGLGEEGATDNQRTPHDSS